MSATSIHAHLGMSDPTFWEGVRWANYLHEYRLDNPGN